MTTAETLPRIFWGRHPEVAYALRGGAPLRRFSRSIHLAHDVDRRIRHFELARPDLHTWRVLTRLYAVRATYRSLHQYY